MKTVRIELDDDTYGRLVKARKKAGVPSVGAYLLQQAGELNGHLEASEIVNKAFAKAERKEANCPFRLRDLFPATEWNGFTPGSRVRAGRMFFEYVGEARDGIAIGKKGSGGHQFYVRH